MFKWSKGVIVLRKILYTFSTAALLLGGLTACNTDQGAAPDRDYDDRARPFGYYSNENERDNNNNERNGYRVRDNDGPLTEIMDITGNNNRKNNRTGTTDNKNNRTSVLNDEKARKNRSGIMNYRDEQRRNGIMNQRNGRTVNPYNDGNPKTIQDNGHGHSDRNYHGHINGKNHNNDNQVRPYGYYNDNGHLVRKISKRASKVKNVEDARVIVTDDNVLVAVDTNDNNNRNNIQNEVKNAIQPLVGNRNINVVTDEGTFTRVRNIDNNIRNGNKRETIDADIKDLFDNIGNTIKEPFTNNRG